MNFNFFGTNKQAEPDSEKNNFQVTEQMPVNELPQTVISEFIDVYNNIVNNRQFITAGTETQEAAETIVQENIYNMNENASRELFNSLKSLAHQIDYGQKTLNEYAKDLQVSKYDYTNSDIIQSFPSPFLVRYSEQLEQTAENVSQEITAFSSHLQPHSMKKEIYNDQNNNNNVLSKFFHEESEAILRSSTKVSDVCKKLSMTRSILCKKLNIRHSQLENIETIHDTTTATSIDAKYKQFRAEQKAKIQKSATDSDLFGEPTNIEQTQSTYSNWGTNTFTSSFTQRRQNSFNPPKPMQVNTSTSIPSPASASKPPPPPTPGQKNPFS